MNIDTQIRSLLRRCAVQSRGFTYTDLKLSNAIAIHMTALEGLKSADIWQYINHAQVPELKTIFSPSRALRTLIA